MLLLTMVKNLVSANGFSISIVNNGHIGRYHRVNIVSGAKTRYNIAESTDI